MEQYELPDGWRWMGLNELIELGSEQIMPWREPDRPFNYVALENVEQGTGRLLEFCPTLGGAIRSSKFRFTPAHVLYGKLRPYLRKALAPDFDGICATDLLPLYPNPRLLHRKFLLWWLLSPEVLEYVVGKQTGVKMPRLRTGDLEGLPVPLPPLSEQERIVARTEALFEQSRTAREALDRVPALVKRFRQSVLAAAFRGDLTERDADGEPASALLERLGGRANHSTLASGLPELPEGWMWVTTAMLAADEPFSFTDGPFGSNLKTSDYVSKGIRLIRLQNIGTTEFKNKDKAFVSQGKFDSLQKHEARPGDVIIAALADPVGRACLVPAGLGTAMVKADCVRLRINRDLADNTYVMLALNTPDHLKRAAAAAHGVGRLRANFGDIQSFAVPLASLLEQRRIVARIQVLFAQADAVEAAVEAARRRLAALDQAVLARAFRGAL